MRIQGPQSHTRNTWKWSKRYGVYSAWLPIRTSPGYTMAVLIWGNTQRREGVAIRQAHKAAMQTHTDVEIELRRLVEESGRVAHELHADIMKVEPDIRELHGVH